MYDKQGFGCVCAHIGSYGRGASTQARAGPRAEGRDKERARARERRPSAADAPRLAVIYPILRAYRIMKYSLTDFGMYKL